MHFVQITHKKVNFRAASNGVFEYVNLNVGFSLLSAHKQLVPS
jgi:hypothetical protein